MRPAVADMGFKDGVAPWRGPLHVWPLMLSQWVGQTMCFYISCDHGWFFLTNGARPNPPPLTCHWGPGIDGESQVSDIRWLRRFVDEAREEGARRSSIKAKPKTSRFDLWGIPNPRMHSLWISRAKLKTRVWCVHVWVCMTRCLGKPRVEDPKWENL